MCFFGFGFVECWKCVAQFAAPQRLRTANSLLLTASQMNHVLKMFIPDKPRNRQHRVGTVLRIRCSTEAQNCKFVVVYIAHDPAACGCTVYSLKIHVLKASFQTDLEIAGTGWTQSCKFAAPHKLRFANSMFLSASHRIYVLNPSFRLSSEVTWTG